MIKDREHTIHCLDKKETFVHFFSSKNLRWLMVLIVLLSLMQPCVAKKKYIESIPFEMVGTYIVIKVKINDSSPLNLILDTGIRNTLITELLPGDNVSLNYANVKELLGLGGGDRLEAFTSNSNTLKIGKIKLDQKTVLVLKEDVFNLTRHTGMKINGLIGVDFLQDYIVDINYTSRKIRFYDKNTAFDHQEEYEKAPLTVEGQKIYIQLSVKEPDNTSKEVKMLMDTGAELTAWFQTFKKNAVTVPQKGIRGTVGRGLNGEIKGKFARISQISLGKQYLNEPIVSFVDSVDIADIVANSDRDGTVGSQFLSRFNYVIDLPNRQLYFKPNFMFSREFTYNVAGIEVSNSLPLIQQSEVTFVWENSPAAKAGIKVGDQIQEIDGTKAFTLTIGEIKKIFETPSKHSLDLILMRDSKTIEVSIDMNNRL